MASKLYRILGMSIPKAESSSAITPEQFLELTKACEDRVQGMLTPNVAGSKSRLRFNNNQCRYLAEKMKLTVQIEAEFRGSSILQGEKMKRSSGFKLLYDVACAVENFIQNCCKDAWVAAALLMPNMSQDVLSMNFDLALLAYFFSGHSVIAVERVYRAEASVVAEKAASDRHLLMRDVEALVRTGKETSAEYQLARFLLEKLETHGAYCEDVKKLGILEIFAFATVYKARWLGIDVAEKNFETEYGERGTLQYQTEVSVLGRLSHPNVASLFCYDDRMCSIVMELMDCDLSCMIHEIMRKVSGKCSYPFSIIEAVNIMLQVGQGVEHVHEMGIFHGNLNSGSILVKELVNSEDGESKSILAKVAGFGLSKIVGKSSIDSKYAFYGGRTLFMPPEVIQKRNSKGLDAVSNDTKAMEYFYPVDVYSFGMLCYEILTGEGIYFDRYRIREMMLSVDRPKLPEHCFPELKELIERCWSQDARKLPRFDEICAKLRKFRVQLLLSSDITHDRHHQAFLDASWKDSDEEQVILCCHNEKDNAFEFYFKHAQDMASIVGVGLDYAKAMLINGCEVQVREIPEEDWKRAWNKGESSSITGPELLKLKTSCLPIQTLKEAEACFEEDEAFQPSLLGKIVNYFTSTMSIDEHVRDLNMSGANAQMSRRGSEKSAVSRFFLGKTNLTPNTGEDSTTKVGKSTGDPGLSDADTIDKVIVVLLPGGEIQPKLPGNDMHEFDRTIFSTMEFMFQKCRLNGEETKRILVTVGDVSFNFQFDEERMPSEQKLEWIHTEMKVSFGLREGFLEYGELDPGSFRQLDVEQGKEITNVSRGQETKHAKDKGGRLELAGAPSGVGIKAHGELKNTSSHGQNYQVERGHEVNRPFTTGGLKCTHDEDPRQHQVVCDYTFPCAKEDYIYDKSAMRSKQVVKFEAAWFPLSPWLVPYTLMAKRSLEKNMEASPEDLNGTDQKKRTLLDKFTFRWIKSETQGTNIPNKCSQLFSKEIYLNHGITHLSNQVYRLKEREGVNYYRYLSALNSYEKFKWKHGKALVALSGEEGSISRSIQTPEESRTTTSRNS